MRMNRFAIAVFVLTAWLIAAPLSAADKMEPIAVFSFAGYDRLNRDLESLAAMAGNPKLVDLFVKHLRKATDIERLDGIDQARPLGAVIATDGLLVAPLVFVPVTDMQQLLASLAGTIGPAKPFGEGVWKIGRGELTGFVRQQGDWAYLAQSRETLTWLPEPGPLLGQLPKTYDLALRLDLQKIPEVFRTMAIDLIRLAMREQLARQPSESQAQHDLRARIAQWRFALVEQLLTESQKLTLGWRLDEQTRLGVVELWFLPKPGGRLAQKTASMKRTETRFGNLHDPAAALNFHVALALDDDQAKYAATQTAETFGIVKRLIEEADTKLSTEEREAVIDLVETLLNTVSATAESQAVDLALTARGKEPPLTLAAAAHIGQGAPLRRLFERFAALGGATRALRVSSSTSPKSTARRPMPWSSPIARAPRVCEASSATT